MRLGEEGETVSIAEKLGPVVPMGRVGDATIVGLPGADLGFVFTFLNSEIYDHITKSIFAIFQLCYSLLLGFLVCFVYF